MNRRRADWRPWAVGIVALALGLPVAAADGAAQAIPAHGKIDWTAKTVTARGSGAPSKKAKNPAAARLGAERAAKLDAFRNILEALKGVQVDATRSADDVMSNGQIKAKVQGVLRGAKVIDTVYYSDLSVDVVLRMPINGAVTQALALPGVGSKKVPAKGEARYSGLVINARGLGVVPAIAPRVFDEQGKSVYGPEFVSKATMDKSGVVDYVKSLDDAKKSARVSDKPLIVRAIGTGANGKSDIVLSNADADKLRDPESNGAYLAAGHVVVVID